MSRMLLGWNSAKLSAQSPPWSRNALPFGDAREIGGQVARLAGEDQRRDRMASCSVAASSAAASG